MENIISQAVDIAGALTLIFTGLYTIALIIPGEQPDKTIEKILDFTKRFSKK